MKILIAGLGNIFQGDDGFGCEVIRALDELEFPEEVTVRDFGTHGYDLAYALADGYDLKILVDAVPQQSVPGTIYLIEPDLERLNELVSGEIEPHSMDPISLLQMARSIGELQGRYYIVGCEPAVFAEDNAEIALSEPVRNAIPEAVKIIMFLVANALSRQEMEVEMTIEAHE